MQENSRTARPNQGEDLIDYRCSDTWLDYYHAQALTPRSSGQIFRPPTARQIEDILARATDDRYKKVSEEIRVLRQEIHRLHGQIGQLHEAHNVRHRTPATPAKNATAFRGIDLDACPKN